MLARRRVRRADGLEALGDQIVFDTRVGGDGVGEHIEEVREILAAFFSESKYDNGGVEDERVPRKYGFGGSGGAERRRSCVGRKMERGDWRNTGSR
jgi:hypothetical protein